MVIRSRQLARRGSQRQRSFAQRRISAAISRGLPPRSRLFQRQIQKEERIIAEDKKQVANIIDSINAGKISNLNQIPERFRSLIGITQSRLNDIQNFFRAKREADLWAAAFKLADRVLDSKNGLAVLAIKFSKNPYAKEAFRIASTNRKAFKQRQKIIGDIRAGKFTDISIINNRIIDTRTGRPITPAQVTNKQYLDSFQKSLPAGEKVLFDSRTFRIKGIESSILRKTIAFTDKSLRAYMDRVSKLPQGILDVFNRSAGTKEPIKEGRVTTFAKKGDAIINNYSKKVSNALKSKGVPVSKFGKFLDRFVLLTKRGLSRLRLGGEDFLKYRANMQKLRTSSIGSITAMTTANREKLAVIDQAIRSNPGMSDSQLVNFLKVMKIIRPDQKDMNTLILNMGKIIAIKAATTLIDLGLATPLLLRSLRKAPLVTIASLPPAVVEGFKQDAKTIQTGNPILITELAVEYYTMGKVFQVLGKASKGAIGKLGQFLPGSRRTINGRIILRNSPKEVFKVRGKTRFLLERVQKPSFKRPFSSVIDFLKGRKAGQFRKFTKDPGLFLKTQTVKSGASPLSAQARLAGQEITAVNAAADQLTSWLRRKKIIRKPIPGESAFPTRIKSLIKRFDTGKKLSFREFSEVNAWLRKNVAGNITLLERSLYLDPASGVRLSRLGIQPERTASLIDILRGNFKFKGNKPQILVFEKAKIAKFPRHLADIKKRLLKGQGLTSAQTNRLIQWQVQTGANAFKPIGSTIYQGGLELEVTLAPGELIKRIKSLGFIQHQGRRVSIVSAEIFKPGKALARRIKLANLGRLNSSALKKLENFLSKRLGRRIQVETPARISSKRFAKEAVRAARRLNPNIPVIRLRGNFLRVLRPSVVRRRNAGIRKIAARRKVIKRKPSRRTPTRKRKIKRPSRKKRVRVKRRKAPRPKRKAPRKRVARKRARARPRARPKAARRKVRPIPRARRGRGRVKKPKPIPRLSSKFGKRNLKKAQLAFFIVIKVRGRKVNLFPKPLVLNEAKDYLAYKLDHGLSRTAWFEPVGKIKRVVRLPKQIKGYFLKNQRKFRPFKIKVGRKKALRRGFIEKRKYISDTRSEKILLARARRGKKRIRRRIGKKKSSRKKRK